MRHASIPALALALICPLAAAQDDQGSATTPVATPQVSPPTFDMARLIDLLPPPGSTLNYGVDPATLTVDPQGEVRYVLVAWKPGGARNVLYEGIRCASSDFRVHARYSDDRGWAPTPADSPWQALTSGASARIAWTVARMGACEGHTPGGSAEEIVRRLRSGKLPGYE